jgi:hypothetical protein
MSRNFVGKGNGYWTGDISKKMKEREKQVQRKPPELEVWRFEWEKVVNFLNHPDQADIRKRINLHTSQAEIFSNTGKMPHSINGRFCSLDDVKGIVRYIRMDGTEKANPNLPLI